VPLEDTTLTVPDLAEMVKEGPVIVTRNGQPWMTVKDASGSERESISLASNPRFTALIEQSRRSYREKGGIRLDDIRRELEVEEDGGDGAPGDGKDGS
jgi:hypothetical protein